MLNFLPTSVVNFADNFCKQFGTRPGSKVYDALVVFKMFILKINQQATKNAIKHPKLPRSQRYINISTHMLYVSEQQGFWPRGYKT